MMQIFLHSIYSGAFCCYTMQLHRDRTKPLVHLSVHAWAHHIVKSFVLYFLREVLMHSVEGH